MTGKKLGEKYNCTVYKFGYGKRAKWQAYRGGNGTGEPVVDLASAHGLTELEKRIRNALGIGTGKVTH